MAKPTLRPAERFGSDPWQIKTWCKDISPGASSTFTASCSFTSTATSCPRESRLASAKVSVCATCWCCVPGTTRIQPFSTVDGVSATQAVTTSGEDKPQ